MKFQGFPRARLFLDKIFDILLADLTYTIPNAIKWIYRVVVKREIVAFPLQNIHRLNERGCLYMHSNFNSMPKGGCAVVMLHGVYGHPFSMLHLADIALEANKGPVFSLHLPYNELHPKIHRTLLKQALDQIESLMVENGHIFNGIVAVGHSLGAIESAYRAFVEKDARIISVISIAGRLRIIPSLYKSCSESLKPTIEIVYQGIQKYPNVPLYQIVAGNDWNAPLTATAVRPDDYCCYIVKNAMHLNVLFRKETCSKFCEFLKKSFPSL